MLVWQRLVATPVSSLFSMQWSRPRRVRERTFGLPRRSSLTTSVPSMLISGVALPSWRSWRAVLSVMSWPLVKIWKKQSGMLGEEVEQLRVHERLAAEDAEEAVAVGLGVVDEPVQVVEVDLDLGLIDVDPAALAAQIAGVEDGDVEERREIDAVLAAAF